MKRFLPAEFSTNPLKKAVRDLLYVFAGKKDVLDYLVSKESEGLTWTGVGTSILLEWVCIFVPPSFLPQNSSQKTRREWKKRD